MLAQIMFAITNIAGALKIIPSFRVRIKHSKCRKSQVSGLKFQIRPETLARDLAPETCNIGPVTYDY